MATSPSSPRIASIDVFRAITMFFMIFVNDLWTISEVPHWLEHAGARENMLGFSDLVFPCFLFVMGMSIPIAIENRFRKGDSVWKVVLHIVQRFIALLVMGLFLVNTEAGVSASTGLNRNSFILLMMAGFFLIWNIYPKKTDFKKYIFIGLKITGVALLVYLFFIFEDSKGGGFQKRWWGILGLIGWSYLYCALIYLITRKNLLYAGLAWLLLVAISIGQANLWLGNLGFWMPGGGTHPAFTMAGVCITLLAARFSSFRQFLPWAALILVLITLAANVSLRFWIISKIQATPTWLFFCLAIGLLVYIFLHWLCDTKGKASWFNIIRPAGTSTLTCYLIPTLLYALLPFLPFHLPGSWLVNPWGLLKCFAYAFICIGITWLLGKIGIKLKV